MNKAKIYPWIFAVVIILIFLFLPIGASSAKMPPKAEILSPLDGATVYSDELIEFIGRGIDPDGNISEYRWGVDGLFIGHGKGIRYRFRDGGKHTITLAVIDNEGLSGEDSVEVFVEVKPVIHLSLAPDVLQRPTEEAKLTITIKTPIPKPSTIVEIQKICHTEGVIINDVDVKSILTPFEVMSGKSEEKTINISASEKGVYPIKLLGYYWLANDPSHPKQIESNEVNFTVVYTCGFLCLTSNPSDNEVYIDDEYAGETPLETKLSTGEHKVKIKPNLPYSSWSNTVTILHNEKTNVEAKLPLNLIFCSGVAIAIILPLSFGYYKATASRRERKRIERLERERIRREEGRKSLEYKRRISELKAKYEQYKREGYKPDSDLEEMLK